MYVIVAYDVVSDRVRRRLHKALHGFLEHVQKSVFEGEVPEPRYADLIRMIETEIDRRIDTVRVFHLCARCRPATEIIGTGTFVETGEEDMIV
ncbi:MAG: CRISPR-associated endonuclease Cas2 [Planctomycetes bacterium]|nr:CRISPR-associated endonuclease Cas2 [Planctomycetota bacterium]